MTSEHFISIHFVSNKIKIIRFILSVIRYIKLVLLPPGAKSEGNSRELEVLVKP